MRRRQQADDTDTVCMHPSDTANQKQARVGDTAAVHAGDARFEAQMPLKGMGC